VHAAIAPVIVIGDVKPNLVLVGVVLVAAYGGLLPAATVAFVAGLTANLLVSEPLGAIPFAMLLVSALVAGGARLLGRMSWIFPPLAAMAGSLVADAVGIGLGGLVADASIAGLPIDVMIRAALLNAAICAALLLPARAVAARYVVEEATAW
jgi:cell shape-determining protein MreD